MEPEVTTGDIPEEKKPEETPGAVPTGEKPGEAKEAPEVEDGQEAQETPHKDDAELAEGPGKEEPEPTKSEKPKKSRTQRRIDTLTKKLKTEQERTAALEAAKQAGENGSSLAEFNEPEPDFTDFESEAEYHKAIGKWTYNKERAGDNARQAKKTAEGKSEDAKRNAEVEAEGITMAFVENIEESKIKEEYADFDAVLESNEPYGADPYAEGARTLRTLVMRSDLGPKIAYYFGKNPEEAQALLDLPVDHQVRALIGIEQNLTKKAKKKESKALPPIDTVQGNDKPAKDVSKMSPREYIRMRNQRQYGVEFG